MGILAQWRARFVHAFFGNLFDLVFLSISLSQAVILWWLFPAFVHSLPVVAQAGAPLGIYCLNRLPVQFTCHQWRDRLPASPWVRAYYAVAFTSLFCAVFLLFVGTLWASAKLFI